MAIATYAISASYLGREMHRSSWRKKKRRAKLKRRIKELGEKADVEGIKEEINSCEEEISKINNRLLFLSVRGAVILPSFCFLVALIFCIYDICADPTGTTKLFFGEPILIRDILMSGAIIAITLGAFFLVKTLFAIEQVASEVPMPKFEVTFKPSGIVKKCKAKWILFLCP